MKKATIQITLTMEAVMLRESDRDGASLSDKVIAAATHAASEWGKSDATRAVTLHATCKAVPEVIAA